MRNAVVVFLWGVAAASLLSVSPAQAEEEAEIPPPTETPLVDVKKDQGNSTIFLDPFPESDVAPQRDILPQDDVVLHTNTTLDDEDEEGELEEGFLERDLACQPKRSCTKKRGKCRSSCKKKEIVSKKGKCKGNCECCVKKVKKSCKQKGPCAEQGTCRTSCHASETPASYLPCKGPKCICCLSKTDQGVCSTSPECAKVRGTCKAACSGEKVVSGLCKGPHCTCCVPPVSCPSTDSCRQSGGSCKSVCADTEVLRPGNCNQGCFCCGPEPTDCTQTPVCPGRCAPMCLGVVSLEAHCLGDSCLCCLDCSPNPTCIDAQGKCKSVCGCGEKEIPNGCKGGGCKCCVAAIPTCELQQTGCSSCMYTPLCKGDPPAASCSGGPGCSCCPP
ncbi:extracellular matrix organizing protein FRAS1-like isoform X2 [Eriocheir sinensis]|uniref:extracellular matrix organizing protein FRAS1-like isoform X2 n=1 Tax=Eriocheir sinensis TaxID=95602 RepID=UPI0021CA757E|nr:extracellular matrix organizing protein FRAS1-like isoform X2 [Eriocheir sinensis]